MMHLVLDYSTLIPCNDKPKNEQKAVASLGEILISVNTTWYVSTEYLKTLYSIFSRMSRECHPLPKLQRGLLRNLRQILRLSYSKSKWCKAVPLRIESSGSIGSSKLRVHIVGKHAFDILKQYSTLLSRVPELQILSNDSREVLALALKASSIANETVYVATTDTLLLDTINRVLDIANELEDRAAENLKRLKPLTPSQLLQEAIRIKLVEVIEEVEKEQELEVEFLSQRQQTTF